MKIFSAALFLLTLTFFSGVPELLPEIFSEEYNRAVFSDENPLNSESEKEDKSEEETKEKEDVKEFLSIHDVSLLGLSSGLLIKTADALLHDPGYTPEDHSPPPELV